MKKFTVLILILCLAVSAAVFPGYTAFPDSNDVLIDYQLNRLDSLGEYQQYVRENDLSGKFIPYSALKNIGEFNYLIFGRQETVDYPVHEDYPYISVPYTYSLVDPCGFTVKLTIHHLNAQEYSSLSVPEGAVEIPASSIDTSNMRTVDFSGNGVYYTHNDLTYYYYNHQLWTIEWTNSNTKFSLQVVNPENGTGYGYPDYPLEQNTFVSKLLNTQTCDDAISPISKYDPVREHQLRTYFLWGGIAIGCLLAIGIPTLIWLKKRRSGQVTN